MRNDRRRRIKNARRHSSEKRRPIPLLVKAVTIFSLFSVIVFIIAILAAINLNIESTRLFGAIGFTLMLLGIISLVMQLKIIKKDKETFVVRVVSVVIAGLVVAAWSYVYIMGIIHG